MGVVGVFGVVGRLGEVGVVGIVVVAAVGGGGAAVVVVGVVQRVVEREARAALAVRSTQRANCTMLFFPPRNCRSESPACKENGSKSFVVVKMKLDIICFRQNQMSKSIVIVKVERQNYLSPLKCSQLDRRAGHPASWSDERQKDLSFSNSSQPDDPAGQAARQSSQQVSQPASQARRAGWPAS